MKGNEGGIYYWILQSCGGLGGLSLAGLRNVRKKQRRKKGKINGHWGVATIFISIFNCFLLFFSWFCEKMRGKKKHRSRLKNKPKKK